MMAAPLIVLYEVSIIGAVIFSRRPAEEDDDGEDEDEAPTSTNVSE